MKYLSRLIPLVFMLCITTGSFAQVVINKDNSPAAADAILHVKGSGGHHFFIDDNTGNVGIGTLTPQERLHIIGNIKLETTSSGSLSDSLLVWSPADSTLKILNPAALSINSRVFSTLSGVTSNEPGDLANDDFVFGAGQLNYVGPAEASRMFFDKSKSAFRAGSSVGVDWNEANLGLYSAAFGTGTRASGDYSFASGLGSKALGDAAMATGQNTEAVGNHTVAMGSNSDAIAENSSAIGYFNIATGIGSQAFGYRTEAKGDYATTMGFETESSGTSSFAAGNSTVASGDYASAFGAYTTASGLASFAVGASTEAIGDYSFSIGNRNSSNGIASGTFGEDATVNGDYSFAFGKTNTITNDYNFAFGRNNTIVANSSFVLGSKNSITNDASYAFGHDNSNSGKFSFTFGSNLETETYGHTVFGSYNEVSYGTSSNSRVPTEPLFEVGNSNSPSNRSTAFYIQKNGKVGIGTKDPGTKFTINGGGTMLRLESTTTNKEMNFSVFGIESDTTLFINSSSQLPVTIGTLTPASGYMLSVDGKMIAEEVRVQLSTAWPDYVFEEDYNLQPLDELEKEIKDLGHLPGMPSAAEVENEGIHLGEMESKLMEKIEELTLHFIELDKRLKSLEAKKRTSQK